MARIFVAWITMGTPDIDFRNAAEQEHFEKKLTKKQRDEIIEDLNLGLDRIVLKTESDKWVCKLCSGGYERREDLTPDLYDMLTNHLLATTGLSISMGAPVGQGWQDCGKGCHFGTSQAHVGAKNGPLLYVESARDNSAAGKWRGIVQAEFKTWEVQA